MYVLILMEKIQVPRKIPGRDNYTASYHDLQFSLAITTL